VRWHWCLCAITSGGALGVLRVVLDPEVDYQLRRFVSIACTRIVKVYAIDDLYHKLRFEVKPCGLCIISGYGVNLPYWGYNPGA